MPEYILFFRNDKIKLYNRFGWFIIIINLLFAAYIIFTSGRPMGAGIAFLVLNALIFALQSWFKKTKYAFGLHPYFFFGIMFWIARDLYAAAAVLFALDMLHTAATKKPVITVSKEDVSYPSFFNTKKQWAELNNLILKDGLVTIDFKNNRVVQQFIDESKTSVNEKEFNEFCVRRLNAEG